MKSRQVVKGLHLFQDLCNVYVLRHGDRGVAIDFGAGRWLAKLPALGIRRLDHVLLTHHHADQCVGLLNAKRRFIVHAPAGERVFLTPRSVRTLRAKPGGFPASYSLLPRGIPGVRYDMAEGNDILWGGARFQFLPTPGHGPHAHSIVLDWAGRQVVFCGDAAHAGATLWQPYQLEWDHWTGTGALAAWEGLSRLSQIAIDLLCPSHGPLIERRPVAVLRRLRGRIMRFYESKLSICPGERDEHWPVTPCGSRISRVLPHLYHAGDNSYVLVSDCRQVLVVDPYADDMPAVERLLRRLGSPQVSAALVTHYHSDHCDALSYVQRKYGTRAVLHPAVAAILSSERKDVPYRPAPVHADGLLPWRGSWQWNEYRFTVDHFPGQTWWHAAHLAEIDRVRVLFGGDSFQPASRWNGTGGYCAFNGSRFRDGFLRSARWVLDQAPDLICGGHGTHYRFHPTQFRKIQKWASRTEKAIRALCPSGRLEKDYFLHHLSRGTAAAP